MKISGAPTIPQSAFDMVLTGIRSQQGPGAEAPNWSCKFRTSRDNGDGTFTPCKCAVGWLIPDPDYNPRMELALGAPPRTATEVATATYPGLNANEVSRLMMTHDDAVYAVRNRVLSGAIAPFDMIPACLAEFEQAMQLLAELYDLTYTPAPA